MEKAAETKSQPELQTLPGDDARQIMWRFADRYELHMLVQAARQVARGPVARLVAAGGRNSHDWTAEKNGLLQHYDESGITAAASGSGIWRFHRRTEKSCAVAGRI